MTVTEKSMPDFDELAPLETFDHQVFLSNDAEEQKVCSFVLTLSLMYNDLKNYMWAFNQIEITKPKEKEIARYNGQHSGFACHLERLLYAHIRAIYDVIQSNQDVLQHPLFLKTIQALRKDVRELWSSLVAIATDDKVVNLDKDTKKFLERIRNKTISHYDIIEVERGHKKFFSEHPMRAYISRGNKMSQIRFYFADAAVDGYFKVSDIKRNALLANFEPFMKRVTLTLYYIVVEFIRNTQKAAFRSEE